MAYMVPCSAGCGPFPESTSHGEFIVFNGYGIAVAMFLGEVCGFHEADMILTGNVLLIAPECGVDITDYRMGDMITVARAIKNSTEFQPFLRMLEEM